MSASGLPPLSLYIHLPWCERKCPYCDFNSHEASEVPQDRYIDALLNDLQQDMQDLAHRQIETLFIGGGTPSLFSSASIARLMRGIAQRVDLSPQLEATMEANPGSAEADKFQGFAEAGINRLSLGIQSFQDEQLQALGRVHSADEAHAAIEMVRGAGFDSFNIDLMHGLPGQTEAGATADLEAALSYHPPHLSWYQLTIEPNTAFYSRPPTLPLEDSLADIQDAGEQILAAADYVQYEVSAFSGQGYQCRHNLNYWSFGDYLGIGAGAHGKVTSAGGRITRTSKRRQPVEYMASDKASFTAGKRELNAGETAGEFMLNALRLNAGFTLAQFCERTGLPETSIRQKVNSLISRDLLLEQNNTVRTTTLGRRFLDTVVAEFF